MFTDLKISTVAHVIQLSVAPVFFLSGVAVTLSTLVNRLARIVDRGRSLEAQLAVRPTEQATAELRIIHTRAKCIHRGITQSVACSLMICFVIATLFLGAIYSLDVAIPVSCLFVLALALFAGSMLSFLREIFYATKSLHFAVPEPPASPPVEPK